MEFFELFVLFGLVVVLPVLLVKMIIDYKKTKLEAELKAVRPENALRVSELKGLIREVVHEELAPLDGRLEWLEDKLEIEAGRKLGAHTDLPRLPENNTGANL